MLKDDQVKVKEVPRIYDLWETFASESGAEHTMSDNEDPDYRPLKIVYGSLMSCGISVLSGLRASPPAEIVDKVLKERSHGDKPIKEAFVTFSDTDHEGRCGGNALCAYIRANNLGQITEFGPRNNPNTNNQIKMWVWLPPHASLVSADKNMPIWGYTLVRKNYGMTYVRNTPAREKRFGPAIRAAGDAVLRNEFVVVGAGIPGNEAAPPPPLG